MAYVITGQTIQISGYFTDTYKKNLLMGDDITVRFFSLGDSDANYFIDETLNKVPEISGDDDADCIKGLSSGAQIRYELNVLPPQPPILSFTSTDELSTIGNAPASFNVMINDAVPYDIQFRINPTITELLPFNASYINRITFGSIVFNNLLELINYTFTLRAGDMMLENQITVFFNNIPNEGIVRNIRLLFTLIQVNNNTPFIIGNSLTIERKNNFTSPIQITNLTGTQGQPLVATVSGTISYPITYTITPTNTSISFDNGLVHTLIPNISQSGLYSVTVRDGFGNTDTRTINIPVSNNLSGTLSYDNNGNFTVAVQGGAQTIRFELLRNSTEVVFDSGLISNNNSNFIINLTAIINGTYSVRITSGTQTVTTNSIVINNANPIQSGLDLVLTRNISSNVILSILGVQTNTGHILRLTRLDTNQITNIPLNFVGNRDQQFSDLAPSTNYTALFIEGQTGRQTNIVSFTTAGRIIDPDRPPSGRPIDNIGCFGFGTKITMSNNTVKNIEDVKIGDTVLSLDIPSLPKSEIFSDYVNWKVNVGDKNFSLKTAVVTNVFFNDYSFYYLINGNTKVTFEHPFMIERNGIVLFVQAKHLLKSDKLYTSSGSFISINKIERVNIKLKTVNIDVEPYNVYFADGVLVHNSDLKEILPSF